jgi:hypothetical protein
MTHKIDNKMLYEAINRWEETAPINLLLDIKSLNDHMLSYNGIEINSWMSKNARVVDEKKYLMFLLRYGK